MRVLEEQITIRQGDATRRNKPAKPVLATHPLGSDAEGKQLERLSQGVQ
jgi:hypothetical protein